MSLSNKNIWLTVSVTKVRCHYQICKFEHVCRACKDDHLQQMYVNMVRIGSLLTHDALSKGRTIDTIEIYALVVVHYEKQGVPTKCHVDFEKHM